MSISPLQPQRRRVRFQFSLRTLMLCVFGYCVLWLLTMKFGRQALVSSVAATYKKDPDLVVKLEDDGSGLVIEGPRGSFEPTSARSKIVSPAPFVLMTTWTTKNVNRDYAFPSNGETRPCDIHFWFFRFQRPLRESPPPKFILYWNFDK